MIWEAILPCAQKPTQVSLICRTEPKTEKSGKEKQFKKRICSEVSVNSPGNPRVSPEEEKVGYGGIYGVNCSTKNNKIL